MSPPTQSILLLGAGTLGLPILTSLATSPHRNNTSITLATRSAPSPTLNALLTKHAVTHLLLDVTTASVESLAETLASYSTVISCVGMTLPAGTQLKLGKAAIAAGVARYFPWQFGVDYDVLDGSSKQDLFTEQMEVRRVLRAQEHTRWVVISVGMFADFLVGAEAGFGAVEREEGGRVVVRGVGGWENKVTATKVEDIARVLAALVFEYVDVEGVVFIAGQTLKYSEVAAAVEKAVGEENVRREEWTVQYLEDELAKDPTNGMKKYRAAFAEGTGVSWDGSTTWNKAEGLELTGIDDWVKEYLLG